MTIRTTYTQEYICDGCKAVMVWVGGDAPPGWAKQNMDAYVTLHACLVCDISVLAGRYVQRVGGAK
jgi:hypothetical protein